jgi:hypothetical protein
MDNSYPQMNDREPNGYGIYLLMIAILLGSLLVLKEVIK